jgi:prepilin signal peptidase PulO-like enzyme (type II secretory pathway)
MHRIAGHATNLSFAGGNRQRLLAFALAVGFGLLSFWRFGWDTVVLTTIFYAWMLLAFAVIDLEQHLVPDRMLLAALPIILVLNLLVQHPTLLSSLVGGFVGLVIFAAIHLARPDGMGLGDVKLAGVIGLMVGFPNVLFALLLGMIAGGLIALLLLIRGQNRQQTLPYVPALAIGAWIVLYLA